MEQFVFPGLGSRVEHLKLLSIKCLALCSLNDQLFGQENILLFVSLFQSSPAYQDICTQVCVIVDFLLISLVFS